MDCGGVFVKYVLFIFNILFVVCGILLIVLGSIMASTIGEITNLHQNIAIIAANSVPIAILVLGCIIFIVAFMGCCGAIRESTCCTMTYSVIMLVLFVCQLAVVICIWVQRPKVLALMDNVITEVWNQRKTSQKVMDTMQLTFNCCGKTAFTDYILAGDEIPNSCCGAAVTSCTKLDAVTRPGCSRAFAKFWENNIDIIRYAGLGVAAIELVAFIFACCLANQVRNSRRRNYY